MFLILRNCTLAYSKNNKEIQFQKHRCLVINQQNGTIMQNLHDTQYLDLTNYNPSETLTLADNQLLLPGLVDTHVHAPQFAFMGTGNDLLLLQWLQKYTFPCQQKFQNLEYAKKIYEHSVNSHLRNGTTAISYFGTIHLQATKILAETVERAGMRGFVGKVCMDQNSPQTYIEQSVQKSIQDTKSFIKYLEETNSSVTAIITPRFAPTCSGELMMELGNLAKAKNLPVQTHLSENVNEIAWVGQLFPDCSSYTDVYLKHGLLGQKSILAHCVHLSEQEIDIILQQKSGISHCPNSNFNITCGMMPARKLLNKGVKMGLGTDVSGGYSPSIFQAMKNCIVVSKLHAYVHPQNKEAPLTVAEAFWLATRGGAELMGLEKCIGMLEKGWQFDALLIDFTELDCFVDEHESEADIFEKVIYCQIQQYQKYLDKRKILQEGKWSLIYHRFYKI